MSKLIIPENVQKNADKLFKPSSYDIRAYVGEPGNFFGDDAVLTPEAMRVAGAIMGALEFETKFGNISLRPKDAVVIGYDNGPTSKKLAESFGQGLNQAGVDVYMIGVSGSGQVYQNQVQLGAQGHVQITRSHVEVTTNGAKFGIGTQGIHTYLLKQMNEACKTGIDMPEVEQGKIYNNEDKGRAVYFNKLKRIYAPYFDKRDNSRVAVNLFGGTGVQYKELFDDILGCEILGADLDVNSGALLADPTRKEMLARVGGFQDGLDSGKRIHSFDLDADRGSVTEGADALQIGESGHYLGDALCFIIAKHKLNYAVPTLINTLEDKGVSPKNLDKIEEIAKTVYIDSRYTSAVKKYVEDMGGKCVFHAKGHSLWKETITENMAEIARLAGYETAASLVEATGYRDLQIEASLHFFTTDTMDGNPRDDAIENIFVLEQVFDKLGISRLESFFNSVPHRHVTKEIRTPAAGNETKDAITADILQFIKENFTGDEHEIVQFEGQIRVDWKTGFIMYGMSNTSPKLTFMAEGESKQIRNNAP